MKDSTCIDESRDLTFELTREEVIGWVAILKNDGSPDRDREVAAARLEELIRLVIPE